MSPCCLDEWKLVVVELDASAEVDGGAWSSQQRGHLADRCSTAAAGGATPDGAHGGTEVWRGHLADGWSVAMSGGATLRRGVRGRRRLGYHLDAKKFVKFFRFLVTSNL
jgi:hypothetical protein